MRMEMLAKRTIGGGRRGEKTGAMMAQLRHVLVSWFGRGSREYMHACSTICKGSKVQSATYLR